MAVCKFPGELKEGEITEIFKTQDPMSKENYCPIIIFTSNTNVRANNDDQIKEFIPFSH